MKKKSLNTTEKAVITIIIGTPLFFIASLYDLLDWVAIAFIVAVMGLGFIVDR